MTCVTCILAAVFAWLCIGAFVWIVVHHAAQFNKEEDRDDNGGS